MADDKQYLVAREETAGWRPPQAGKHLQTAGKAQGYGGIPESHAATVEETRGVEVTDALPETSCFDRLCNLCSCRVNCCTEREDRGSQSRVLLRRARREGWWMVRCLILPHVLRRQINLVWVALQIVVSLILVGFSIGAIVRGPESEWTVNFVHVMAVGLWAILSLGDGVLMVKLYSRSLYVVHVFDVIVRMVYTVICLYVALMCDLAHFRHLDVSKQPVLYIRTILTLVSYAAFVYVVVIGLTGRAIAVVNKLSNKDPSKTMGNSARNFLIRFLVNLLLQIVIQITMLSTITQRIDDVSAISKSAILIMGLVAPVTGTLVYFVTGLYWIQESLVGICTTVLCIASDSSAESGKYLEWLIQTDYQRQRLERLKKTIDMTMLKGEAVHLLNVNTVRKTLFYSQFPVANVLSIVNLLVLQPIFPLFAFLPIP